MLLLLMLGSMACEPRDPARGSLDAYQRGRVLVERALSALGGEEALQRAGGVMVVGEGTVDLSVHLQGMHPARSYPVAAQETLAVDWSGHRVAYETHAKVNPDADEWIRYVYDRDGRMLIVLRLSGHAFWAGATPGHKQRYRRMVPHALLRDALAQRQTLRALGRMDGHEAVTVTLSTGEAVTLLIDADDDLLRGVEYVVSLPVHGDTRVRWHFDEYQAVDGLGPYPTGYRIEVGDRLLKTMRYTHIEAGQGSDDFFGVPDGIPAPPLPPDQPASASPESESADEDVPDLPTVRSLADGVYLAVNVRGGFHHLFVEFEDFVLVVDAPAGYHELQMIPAVDWAGDVTPSSVGRRLLDAVHATVPGKPVRYVVLTHHHGDHAGGLRPFIDAGATILAGAPTMSVIEAVASNAFTVQPDTLTGRSVQPAVEVVEGERTISDGRRRLRIIDVGENPHAEGMLVVFLPEERMLYQSDLFMPAPSGFPDPARRPVMQWFADWLDRSGLASQTIYAVHGSSRVTDEQLAQIRALDTP
jgi:glyoxylase-like metal-dependent hydrolase (beta-lactamase superfamily II)